MRVISWNCCDAFNRKFGHLERLQPDIAIISECRPECLQSAGLRDRSVWVGNEGQKGLAVIPYNGWTITGSGPAVSQKWFVPLILSNGSVNLRLIAIWVNDGTDYVQPTLRALDDLRGFMNAGPVLLAGDFNQSVVFDKRRGAGKRFADVLARLETAGLVSAWHSLTGEAQGQESQATLYWRWQQTSPFHIDYLFYPPAAFSLKSIEFGSYEQYVAGGISDHVPLVAALEVRSADGARQAETERAPIWSA